MNISKQAWLGFAIGLATPFVFLPLLEKWGVWMRYLFPYWYWVLDFV